MGFEPFHFTIAGAEHLKLYSLRSQRRSPRILVPGIPLAGLSLIFTSRRKMVLRGGNEPLAKEN
jgi:hypothetical protein